MEGIKISTQKPIPSTGRVEWVDVAKGVGIVLVVLAHALPKDHVIWQFINQFHMPFFFIVSGYLYSTKTSWVKFVVRKIRSLWIPFVFSSVLTMAVSIVIEKTSVGGGKEHHKNAPAPGSRAIAWSDMVYSSIVLCGDPL